MHARRLATVIASLVLATSACSGGSRSLEATIAVQNTEIAGLRSTSTNTTAANTPQPLTITSSTATILTPIVQISPSSTAIPPIAYVVKANDTCAGIASIFGIPLTAFLALNNLDENNCLLRIGDQVLIPQSIVITSGTVVVAVTSPTVGVTQTYTVVEGDTLWGIAVAFQLSLDELIAANPDLNPDRMYSGEVLVIPVPGTIDVSKITRMPTAFTIPSVTARVKVDANGLRLRKDPSVSDNIITRLPAGTLLTLVSRSKDDYWLLITLTDGTLGWVMAQYLDINGDLSHVPVITNYQGQAGVTPEPTTLPLVLGWVADYRPSWIGFLDTYGTLVLVTPDGSGGTTSATTSYYKSDVFTYKPSDQIIVTHADKTGHFVTWVFKPGTQNEFNQLLAKWQMTLKQR